MLQPKRTKHRKHFRGKMKGDAKGGFVMVNGEIALQATDRSWIDARQIEAARKAIVRETKRKGKVWLRIFPDKPFTKKPAEVRMGKGKGDVAGYVSVVKPGRVIFEIAGVPLNIAREALRKAGHKLSVKTQIIERQQA
jgi:large subunit ribosomal protein L16